MNNYVIKRDFIELKHLYENGDIEKFEKRILDYSIKDIFEFSAYFSVNIKTNDEYYIVKIIAEIIYNIIQKSVRNSLASEFFYYANNALGRCIYLSSERKLWNDVIKYGTLLSHYVTDEEEVNDILDYLGMAYFYQGNFKKELEIREQLLDNDNYLSLYNYALALFHNMLYEEARVYYQRCLEKLEFPPALRNQAHLSVILDDDYIKAYDFCEKALLAYYKNENQFPLVNPFIYLAHQLFLCGLSSSDKLFSELNQHKLKFEDGIRNNDQLSNNIHMINFINACSLMNRGIHYFEQTDFGKSVELFEQVIQKVHINLNEIDKSTPLGSFNDKLKEVAEFYILLVKIINSFKSLFNCSTVDINDELKKINDLQNILINNNDNEFTYEYKKIISLFLKYLSSILKYFFDGDKKEVIDLTNFLNQLKLTKNNYIMNILSLNLFKLNKILNEYENNSKLEMFQEYVRDECINNIKEICDSFCNNIKIIKTTFTIPENIECSNEKFCEKIIRAIFHIKKHIPSYVKEYLESDKKALQEDKKAKDLQEEDFRDTFGLFFGSIYDISSEEWRKEGRTDLIVNTGNNSQKIIEFKVWGRNDYKDIVKQVIDRYLTEFDDAGYIFMINSNKSPIVVKYLEYVKDRNTGYIANSLQVKNINNFKYYSTRHKTDFSEYKIYHFILDIFD